MDQVILQLTVTGEDGESEMIGTTLTHPFRVAEGAWVEAGNFAVGDQIASHDDGILTVTKRRAAHELHDTFNFEVADFHTYFVGEVGAWVHNVCKPGKYDGWSKSRHIKEAQLPNQGKIRYVPPENWYPSQPLPKGNQHGYIDKFGNEWVKGQTRTKGQDFEWDVQRPDGTHWNISLDGKVTH